MPQTERVAVGVAWHQRQVAEAARRVRVLRAEQHQRREAARRVRTSKPVSEQGAMRLWTAVLERAVADAQGFVGDICEPRARARAVRDAREWLASEEAASIAVDYLGISVSAWQWCVGRALRACTNAQASVCEAPGEGEGEGDSSLPPSP